MPDVKQSGPAQNRYRAVNRAPSGAPGMFRFGALPCPDTMYSRSSRLFTFSCRSTAPSL